MVFDRAIARYCLRACALLVGVCATAQAADRAPRMSTDEYLAAKRRLSADFHAAKAACSAQTAGRLEICVTDVMGRDWVAKADLEVAYRSEPRSRAEASLARADARFWLARELCDDERPGEKSACVRQATALRTAARDEIAAQRKAEEREEQCARDAAAFGAAGPRACAPGAAAARAAGHGKLP